VNFDFPFNPRGDSAAKTRRKIARRQRRSDRSPRRRRPGELQSQSGPVRGHDSWKYVDRRIYVDDTARRRTPFWLVPAVVTVLLAVLVFFIVPYAVSGLQTLFGKDGTKGRIAERILDEAVRLVRVDSADVLDRPDLRGMRITQILYNAPVETDASRSAFGFTAVKLADGTEGYVANGVLTSDRDSAEPNLFKYKLVVSDRVRRIMSHATQGTLIQEVMMGTVLYSDFRGDGIYRVALPGGGTGWIGGNGLIELPVGETVQPSGADAFVSSAMDFLNMTYLPGGITQDGIDSAGLIRIAAFVNGRELPRKVDALGLSGQPVALARDEKSGALLTEGWRSGDLVLFAPIEGDLTGATFGDIALYVGEGQVLMARTSRSSIRLVTLADEPALFARVSAVRRVFPTI